MSNGVIQSLNKGVPVDASIDIRYADFINIVDNKDKVEQLIFKNFENYMDFIHGLGETYDIEYFRTLSTVIDPDTLEKKVIFSPSGFLSTLVYNLNIEINNSKAQSGLKTLNYETISDTIGMLDKPLRKRVEMLRQVNTVDELRKSFPLLYNKYQELVKSYQQVRVLAVKLNSMGRKAKREYIRMFDAEQSKTIPGFSLQTYMNKAINFNIGTFVQGCANAFVTMLDNQDAILNYVYTHPLDFSELDIKDINKLELYFATIYLNMAEVVGEKYKQDYLYYVSSFFVEHKDLLESDLSIAIDNYKGVRAGFLQHNEKREGYIVTPSSLYDRYRKLLVNNPNLRAIDFSHFDFNGMTASEVKLFMDEYLKDLSAQWEFLAPDDKSYEEEIVTKIRGTGEGMTEVDRERHQARLLELLLEKKSLYDSSDPFFRVKGKGTFDGYIGYIYSNGRVVLDKFYEDFSEAKPADGHAVYAMGIQEFYELSRLSKTAIIRNKLCKRYIHKGNWADRVLKNEIKAEGLVNPCVEVKRLIKDGEVVAPAESLPICFGK